ncbi:MULTISPECIES: zinc ribbon domain-containing protein [Halorubrum]|uniref:Zinc ribbon domain-containing protein n=1 Tax=Halorubrum ezzemoulense TaxID=337243 RepID=A0A256JX16_HALEZ|nr:MULTISPECIES: zinc ribbon domain-containing protein [Halorubrum]OYR61662.1 zinc ribbon domain-containing protein [Halorubrum ezzemoulense]OYR73375.1 zinc ribbon domain-containing protein [Halorubrum ezzemoulense]TKX38059.1 zinc ribbon domain-containing protein [Halorubrum sp. CGM5_25_10-8B]
MPSCPRCDAPVDDEARYCGQCGAPQTEDAAEELDEYVQRQAEQVAGGSSGGGGSDGGGSSGSDAFPSMEELSDREQLWRRGSYVLGYGTVVIALTRVPAAESWPLILAGVAILPPIRRLTAGPLGSPLKREVMAGAYAIFALIGVALFALL